MTREQLLSRAKRTEQEMTENKRRKRQRLKGKVTDFLVLTAQVVFFYGVLFSLGKFILGSSVEQLSLIRADVQGIRSDIRDLCKNKSNKESPE